MRRLLALAAALILIGTQSSAAPSIQTVAKTAFASTLLLIMQDANKQPIALGSGFIIGDRQVATNYHVIQGANGGTARLIGSSIQYRIEGIVASDPARDLAILSISISSKPLTLGDSNLMQVGDTVYAVGNPLGLEGTFSQGIVSGVRSVGADSLIQLTAPISPGSSGGPVLNAAGAVIGVAVATLVGGQNLNFAIPANYLKALMQNTSAPKALSSSSTPPASSTIVSTYGAEKTEDFITVSQVAWMLAYGQTGDFSFSIRNKLSESIVDVIVLIVFYDRDSNPIDAVTVNCSDVIPPGLAKRVTGKTDGSVQQLTTLQGTLTPQTKVAYRVLDFRIAP